MRFPLVLRKRLDSANARIGILEATVRHAGEERDKISGHNATLKVTLGTVRNELIKANVELKGVCAHLDNEEKILDSCRADLAANTETIKGQQAEIERLTAAFEKLTADYNELGRKIPAFRPKAVRWSGPDGARAAIERAAYAESPAGKREAVAKAEL